MQLCAMVSHASPLEPWAQPTRAYVHCTGINLPSVIAAVSMQPDLEAQFTPLICPRVCMHDAVMQHEGGCMLHKDPLKEVITVQCSDIPLVNHNVLQIGHPEHSWAPGVKDTTATGVRTTLQSQQST